MQVLGQGFEDALEPQRGAMFRLVKHHFQLYDQNS